MRKAPPVQLENARRDARGFVSKKGDMHGSFIVRDVHASLVIISSGTLELEDPALNELSEWEHVSISLIGFHQCPTWDQMCFIKNLFWEEEETVVQFHPPKSEHVNNHPYCLHLWKPPYAIPTPPAIAIGIKENPKGQRPKKL